MPPIKVYGLDAVGVITDNSPIGNPLGTLTKSQNAIADPLGQKGSIRKRPGLKQFNQASTGSAILGGIGIPIFLGSAGPDFQNPFIDTTVTIASYLTEQYRVSSNPRLGADFNDRSYQLPDTDFDVNFEFGADYESDEELINPGPNELDDPSQVINPLTGAVVAGPTMFPLTILGSGTDWYVSLNVTMTEHTDNTSTPDFPLSMIFPITSLRIPSALSDWSTGGSTTVLNGRPIVTANNVVFYAESA